MKRNDWVIVVLDDLLSWYIESEVCVVNSSFAEAIKGPNLLIVSVKTSFLDLP